MSEAVDTRVVEARFDSAQFEKGVDRTVKKLDELKSSLNLKDSGKSVADLTSKIQEGTQNASNSLEKLQERFTSFTGMLKQKLLSGIADEIVGVFFKMKNAFEGFVTSLSTAQISVGMNRYTEMLNSVRTLVSAGVEQGHAYEAIERLGEYADQTSYSLDAMVSTMSKFKTAGADLNTAARMIEGLSNAAASMGVNAQDAQRAYLNLQQAYSKGAMLQNDWISFESLPMVGEKFNEEILKAAVKVGTLKASKPDKNGNVTYQTVKKSGTDVKTSGADAKGITAQNMGTKLSSRWFNKEVMEEVFGNTYYFAEVGIDEVNEIKKIERSLKEQMKEEHKDQSWFDEEFQKKLDEISDRNIAAKKEALDAQVEAGEITQEAADKLLEDFSKTNHLTKFAYDAFRAGQEARSFTDVINTLKDAISRGWAKSFELIFGKLDEAADFFTRLTESQLAEAIYAVGEFRNEVLENWRNSGGRDSMLSTLQTIDDLFGSIFEKMGLLGEKWKVFDQAEYDRLMEEDPTGYAATEYERWAKAQGTESAFTKAAEELGERLAMVTSAIGYYIEKIKLWFTEVDPKKGTSRLDRIMKVFTDLGSILRKATNLMDMAVGKSINLFGKLEGPLAKIWESITKVLKPIDDLLNPKDTGNGPTLYQNIEHIFDNIAIILDKLVKTEDGKDGPLTVLIGVIGDVAAFFMELATGTFAANVSLVSDTIGLIIELLFGTSSQKQKGKGVGESIADDIITLGDACKTSLQAIHDFFDSVVKDIREWLGISDDPAIRNQGIFHHIEEWFNTNEALQKIKLALNTFVIKVKAWFADLPTRIGEIGVSIGDFFKSIFYHKTSVANSGTVWVKKDFTKQLEEWFENAKTTLKEWFGNLPARIGEIGVSIGDFFKSIFYHKTSVANTGTTVWVKKDFTKQLEEWFANAKTTLIEWFANLPERIRGIGISIGDFFKSIFYNKTSVGNNKTIWVKKDFTKQLETWFENVKRTLKEWFANLPERLSKFGVSAGDFFKSIFYNKTSVANTDATVWVKKDFTKQIEEFVKNIPVYIHDAFVGVGDFFKMVWDALLGNSSPTTSKSSADGAANDIQASIDESFSSITENTVIERLKEIGRKIGNAILTIFTGNTDADFNQNWLASKVKEGVENISKWAEKAWEDTCKFIVDLPSTIAGIFENKEEQAEPGKEPKEGTVGSAILTFAHNIGTWISMIPSTILGFWENAEKEIGKLWSSIVGWITGDTKNLGKKLKPEYQQMVDQVKNLGHDDTANAMADSLFNLQWREDNPILANLEDFFIRLKDYFIDKIIHLPENIAEGLNTGASIFETLITTATGWLNEENSKKNLTDIELDTKDAEQQDSPLLKSLESFGKTIWRLITETIPGFISAGFTWIATNVSSWFSGLNGLFDNGEEKLDTEDSPFIISLKTFGSTIWELITNKIPGYISSGFTWIKDNASTWIGALTGIFSGGEEKVGTEAESFGDTIVKKIEEAIRSIPDRIRAAIQWLRFLFKKPISKEIQEALTHPENQAYKNQSLLQLNSFNKGQVISKEDIKNFRYNFKTGMVEMTDEAASVADDAIDDFDIWGSIKGIGESIGDAFADLGPDIVEGLNKAFTWIGDALGSATKHLSEAVSSGKSLTEIVDDNLADPEKNEETSKWAPLWEAVKNVGRTLKHIILEVIPDFITSAAGYIWQHLPEWISGAFGGNGTGNALGSMGSMFEGVLEENEIEGADKLVSDFAEELNAETKELDKASEDAKQNVVAKSKFLEYLAAKEANYKDLYEHEPGYTDKVTEYRTKMNHYHDLIKLVKEDAISNVDITKYLTTEEELSDFFSAQEVDKDAKQAENGMNAAEVMINAFSGFIGNVNNVFSGQTGQTIVYLGMAAVVLSQVKEILSLSDELYAVKGIVLGVVFAGIVALLGYITYLGAQKDQTGFNNAMEMLEKIRQLLEMIAVIAGLWKGFDALGDLFGGGEGIVKGFAGGAGAGLVDLADTVLSTWLMPIKLEGILTVVNEAVGGFVDTFTTSAIVISQGIDTVLAYILPAIRKASDASKELKGQGDFINDLKKFFLDFTTFFTQQWFTNEAAPSILDWLAKITNPFNSVNGAVEKEEEKTKNIFEANLNLVNTIAVLCNEFSSALRVFEQVENPEEALKGIGEILLKQGEGSFIDIFGKFLNLIYNLSISSDLVADRYGLPPMDQIAQSVEYISGVLSIFSVSLNDISDVKLNQINQFFTLFQQLAEGSWMNSTNVGFKKTFIAKMLTGDTSLSAFGQVLSQFMTHMTSVFSNIKTISDLVAGEDAIIDDKEMDRYKRSIDLVYSFAEKLFAVQKYIYDTYGYVDSGGVKTLYTFDTVDTRWITDFLPLIGLAFKDFMNNVMQFEGFQKAFSMNYDFDAFMVLADFLQGIGNFAETTKLNSIDDGTFVQKLNIFADGLFGEDGMSGFFGRLKTASDYYKSLGDSFGGIRDFVNLLYDFSHAIEVFYEKDENGEFNFLTGLKNMTGDEMRQLFEEQKMEIVPVLKIDAEFEKEADRLRTLIGLPALSLGEDGLVNGIQNAVQIDTSFLQDFKPINYENKFNDITYAIRELRETTSSLSTSMANMAFIIDGATLTDKIGPTMDMWLGQQAHFVVRAKMT